MAKAKKTPPAKRTFCVYATESLYQHVEATSAREAYEIADKDGFEPCGDLEFEPNVQDVQTCEYIHVGKSEQGYSLPKELCSVCSNPRSFGGRVLKRGECNLCVVVDDMWEAMGEVLVRHFPEAVSGDTSPLVSLSVDRAHRGLAIEWIHSNVPGKQP